MINLQTQRYAFFALLAALLFGASTPFAKILLGSLSPQLLAGLLYLGSGIGLLIIKIVKINFQSRGGAEGGLPTCASTTGHPQRQDPETKYYLWFAASILCGGILAPLLLMWGLVHAPASSASLLLNFESALTVFAAAMLFHEAVALRVWLAAAIMLIAGLLLSYTPHTILHFSLQSLAIMGACGMWALDNNCTRKIAVRDPFVIGTIKGLVAGVVNIGLSFLVINKLVINWHFVAALGLGFLSYGVSLVFFILSLRHLGAARTSVYFSTAPFISAVLAILLLSESITKLFCLAFFLMLIATWLVLTEEYTKGK